MNPFRHLLLPAWIPLLVCATFSQSVLAKEAASFMGWIPVQTLTGGKATEIDLTRFLSLAAGAKLEMERPSPLSKTTVNLDPAKLLIQITPEIGAQGMEDLRFKILPAQG
ncbi:MAG: hypothetical protein ACO3CL_09125, partial [Bacteroidia bacterium]